MYNPFTQHVMKALQNSDIYDEKITGEKISFKLPSELMYVMYIHPKAFAHYLPEFLREEMRKKTDKPFKIGALTWEQVADRYIDGDEITITITGRVRVFENEESMESLRAKYLGEEPLKNGIVKSGCKVEVWKDNVKVGEQG
jgi:hypothetical protein